MERYDAPVKAIVFDLDGTFLTSEKEIPQENVEALEKAYEKGILIVPATGRFYKGVSEPIRKLPFIRYFITINGADFFDTKAQQVIHSRHLTKEKAFELMDHLETLPVLFDCVIGDQGWMKREHYDKVMSLNEPLAMRELILELHKPVPDLREIVRNSSETVQKLQLFTSDRAFRAELLKELPERYPELSISSAVDCNIEFNRKDATKADLIRYLCEIGGFGMENVMCIGDGLNDVDMVRAAGLGVAMGNGVPEILEAADHVTGDCDHGGFAEAVRKFCLS